MNPFLGNVYLPRAVLPLFVFVLGLYLSSFFVDDFVFIFLVGFAYVYAIVIYALQAMHSSSSVVCPLTLDFNLWFSALSSILSS